MYNPFFLLIQYFFRFFHGVGSATHSIPRAQTVPFDPLLRSDDHTSLSLRDVAERQHCSGELRFFILRFFTIRLSFFSKIIFDFFIEVLCKHLYNSMHQWFPWIPITQRSCISLPLRGVAKQWRCSGESKLLLTMVSWRSCLTNAHHWYCNIAANALQYSHGMQL